MIVNEWLNENKLGMDIWKNKYQCENETFDEWLDRVTNKNESMKQLILDKKFLFGGRILSNRGLDKKGKKITLSNCYVLPQVEDSIEGIYKTCSDLARTFSYGGGVGVDLSNLRPRGSIVNNTAKTTTGAVSFMETFSNVAETIGQNGRRAALMLSLDVSHPDIEEFVNIKTDLNKVTKANISVRITDDFMKAVENNENYVCKFFVEENKEEIKKEINARELFLKLCENNYNYAEPGILYWNRIEDYNLLQHDEEFEYAGVNPCAEECLPAGGSCLLGSFNLDAYVKNKEFNYTEFANDIFVVVEAMNEVLDEGLPLHPLEVQRQTVRDYRQIGIGVMGIADMLIHMECKYGSKESLEICDKIGKALADNVLRCSALLAKDHGKYPKYKESILESDFIKENASQTTLSLIKKYGLRNSQLLTIAPTGSLSTMLGISGGIEPIFENSYTRKTESLHNKDVYYKVYTPIVEEYIKEHDITEEELPDYFVTAMSLDALNRVQMQGVFQKHIDASISSTVNLPNEATIEDVYEIYVQAWKLGLKGVTIYRSGCKREGILTKNGNDNNNERELKRGEWEKKPDHIIEITRKLKSGCGKMTLHIGIIPEEKRIFEVYVTNSSRGGCVLNIQNLAITISNALRTGSNLQSLKKSYEGTGSCPSYATARAKNKKVSKGNSCGTSILYALLDVESDLKNDNLPELQKLGYYNTPKEKAEDQKVEKELTEQELIDMGLCPECQEPLIATGGCKQCSNCSWTKCE